MGSIYEVSATQLYEWLKTDAAILIDVRELNEYQNKKIPNAYHIPLSCISTSSLPDIQLSEKKIVLYCRSGKRSMTACEKLHLESGDFDLWNLTGGILFWEHLQLPIIEY